MTEETITKAEAEAAFIEWYRRLRKEPRKFVSNAAATAMTPEELGRRSAESIFEIARELRNSTEQ